jgi:aspartyl protease family protein
LAGILASRFLVFTGLTELRYPMWRYIFLGISLVGFSLKGPEMMTKILENRDKPNLTNVNVNRNPRKTSSINPLSGRIARAKMTRNGHFYFNTKMNGASVKVMVDTGATGVAINRSTARRLGIRLSNSDFKYKSQTANGIAYYAAAKIDEIRIGRVVVYDVRAAVLKDSSLSETLLGMTFLRKLKKFEISNDTLTLTQ